MARVPRLDARVQNPSISYLSNFRTTAEYRDKTGANFLLYTHKNAKTKVQTYVTLNTYNTLEEYLIIINNNL